MNRSSRFVALSALVIGLVGVTQPAVAQRLATSRLTSGPAIRKLLKPVLVETRKATVEVISEGETVALGTVVSEDGVIVTKASELGGTARCRFFDGEVRKAEIVTVDKQNDLALLKVDAEELDAIDLSDKSDASVGSWAITVGIDEEPAALGVVSNPPRSISASRGVLGISIMDDNEGAQVTNVYPNSSADRAGLKVGDVIRSISGQKILDRAALSAVLRSFRPGDPLMVQVVRGMEPLTIRATLGYPINNVFSRSNFQNVTGGALSGRRDGFSKVVIHDTQLARNQCGGPLIDLKGNLIGVNIARAARTDSYALPRAELISIIGKLKEKLPASDGDTAAAADKSDGSNADGADSKAADSSSSK